MMHGWGGGIWMASGCWSSGRHHPPDRLRDPGRVERPDGRGTPRTGRPGAP